MLKLAAARMTLEIKETKMKYIKPRLEEQVTLHFGGCAFEGGRIYLPWLTTILDQ